MSAGPQEAILASLARGLTDHGSWSGETHIQKATYILHDLFGVPFDFDFILYKHGPFSFELRDTLSSMRIDGLLERQPQPGGYGPRILASPAGVGLQQTYPRTMNRWNAAVEWIAERLGNLDVNELERLATALWVTRERPEDSVNERAEALTSVKPHIPRESAVRAVGRIDQLIEEAGALAVH